MMNDADVRAVVTSGQCYCSRAKPVGETLCHFCWSKPPGNLHDALLEAILAQFADAYSLAVVYVKRRDSLPGMTLRLEQGRLRCNPSRKRSL